MAGQTLNFVINRPNIQKISVEIVGTSPMIQHKFSEKAKREMLEKQQKKAAKKKEARDPEKEYQASLYKNSKGKVAFPALAVKQAIVSAARNVDGLPMTILRGAVFIKGDEDGLIEVIYPKGDLIMREDVVRIGMGSADLRYRGEIRNWSMKLPIEFNADVLSTEQILNLLQTAGFACGLGEWRPERNGESGTFTIKDNG